MCATSVGYKIPFRKRKRKEKGQVVKLHKIASI